MLVSSHILSAHHLAARPLRDMQLRSMRVLRNRHQCLGCLESCISHLVGAIAQAYEADRCVFEALAGGAGLRDASCLAVLFIQSGNEAGKRVVHGGGGYDDVSVTVRVMEGRRDGIRDGKQESSTFSSFSSDGWCT